MFVVIFMNEIIISKENEKIKFLKKLSLHKYREESGKFFIENAATIYDAAQAGYFFEALFTTQEFISKNKKFAFLTEKIKSAEYYLIDGKVNKSFSNLDTPSGICAVYEKKEKPIDYGAPIVYLNGISDPGNLGTIMRSALAFSFKNIIADEHCADIYSPKTINAAKDAIFKLNIVRDKNFSLLKKVKEKMKICAATLTGAEDIAVIKKFKPVCVVLGSESRGVDENIIKLADKQIKINIFEDMESLNVACAAAIIFYAYSANNQPQIKQIGSLDISAGKS